MKHSKVLSFSLESQKRVIRDSGLNVKLPIIQNTVKYDKRILEYDLPIEEVIAVDKKRMLVDSFTRFKITDPLEFYKTVGMNLM